MAKKKNIFKPDWGTIIQGVYSNATYGLLALFVATVWALGSRFDPLGLGKIIGQVLAILLYLLMALGAGLTLYSFWRLLKKIKQLVSHNEDEEDYVSYPGLIFIEDANGVNQYEYFQLDTSMVRLWVVVSNGKKHVYDCQVVLDNFEYCGNQKGSTWGSAYSGFDRKAMKWDVGYSPNDGKIELERDSKKLLEIARATRKHPDINMRLSHLDGYATRVYNLDGKYRATLRIDGKILIGNIKKPIKALKYRVTFKYEQLPLLKIIEIERI